MKIQLQEQLILHYCGNGYRIWGGFTEEVLLRQMKQRTEAIAGWQCLSCMIRPMVQPSAPGLGGSSFLEIGWRRQLNGEKCSSKQTEGVNVCAISGVISGCSWCTRWTNPGFVLGADGKLTKIQLKNTAWGQIEITFSIRFRSSIHFVAKKVFKQVNDVIHSGLRKLPLELCEIWQEARLEP